MLKIQGLAGYGHVRACSEAVFHTEMQRIDYNVQTPLQLARVDERIDEDVVSCDLLIYSTPTQLEMPGGAVTMLVVRVATSLMSHSQTTFFLSLLTACRLFPSMEVTRHL